MSLGRVTGGQALRALPPAGGHDRLEPENVSGRGEALEPAASDVIVGQSPVLRRVLEQARQVAATDSTVLLLGETGTGKELIAAQIHQPSRRTGRAMVRVNCAAIPSPLIESELFGRVSGAFTGAVTRQIGRFELAARSTIFLDEIGDLPLDAQVRPAWVTGSRAARSVGAQAPKTSQPCSTA